MKRLKSAIRNIPDFPQKGVLFRDITPVLADAELFKMAVDIIANRYARRGVRVVAAVEARGFILGAAVACALNTGFVPIRKKGKLPFKTIDESCDLEYGSATLSIHMDAVEKGHRVLIVDDLLATGGTAAAAAKLIERLGGEIVEMAFLVELGVFHGRDKLKGRPVFSAIVFD